MDPKQIRIQAKKSLTAAAAIAGVSPATYRVFEARREAVTPERRAQCDAAIAKMASAQHEVA